MSENYKRWNFELYNGRVCACDGKHGKVEGCTLTELSNSRIFKILKDMQSMILSDYERHQILKDKDV